MGTTSSADLIPGTLDMLILKTVSRGEAMHGYAIAQSIHQISEDMLRVGRRALSCAASAGSAGPAPLAMGSVREQSPGEVLQPDGGRTPGIGT
jgi:hypothetical protein